MSFAQGAGLVLAKKAKEAALEIVSMQVFPALKKVVAESPSPIDDVVLAALEEPLKKALIDLVNGL